MVNYISEMQACDEVTKDLKNDLTELSSTWANHIFRRDFEGAENIIIKIQNKVADLLQDTQFCEARLGKK